jgi:hypothetical protein
MHPSGGSSLLARRCLTLLACPLVALAAGAGAAQAAALPPPGSEYATRAACPTARQGRAECLALDLRPKTATARRRAHLLATRTAPTAGLVEASECAVDYPSSCLTPEQLRDAYFPGEAPEAPAGEPQTIALVDAYNDPSAEADLAVYSSEFALPPCTSADGCFEQVGQSGGEGASSLPFPKTKAELETYAKGTASQRLKAEEAEGWALEISTDIEVAHAICRNCQVLLVAAKSPNYSDLEAAEETAAASAQEISNSWGGSEPGGESKAFDHAGLVITAAAGDDGYLNWDQYATREEPSSPYFPGTDYPATSPHVIAVGGTRLQLSAGGAWQSESPWNAGGSGCSQSLTAPEWQTQVSDWAQVGCGALRASADVSADADPATGVNVYDSIPYPYEEAGHKLTTVLHWVPIGGTSVASPIIASMFALAGGADGVAYPAQILYSHLGSPLLHDVHSGGDGECQGEYFTCSGSLNPLSPRFPLDCGAGSWICNATTGYDGPTGVGTPNGLGAFRVAETPVKEGSEPGQGEPEGKPEEELTKGEEPPAEESPPNEGSGSSSEKSGGSESPSAGTTDSGSSQSGSTAGNTAATSTAHSTDSALAKPSGGPILARVRRLALTAHGSAALHLRAHARGVAMSRVAFSFVLTSRARVRAILSLRVGVGPRRHWVELNPTLSFSASAGAHRRALRGSRLLRPGLYRLTLSPLSGISRSITVRVL